MNKNYIWKDRFLPYLQKNVPFCNTSKVFKNMLLLSLLFITSFWSNLQAEGSKNLYPSGATGNRAFLYSNSYTAGGTTINSWPFKTLGTHYVYASEGESIAAASSAQNLGNGRIRMISPNGVIYFSAANTNGQIPDRAGELAGPRFPGQAAGGNRYAPYTLTVGAGQAGVWKIEFLPTGTEDFATTPPVVDTAADAAWAQPANTSLISAWDVSVRNAANTAWISGRVYTNVFNLYNQGTSFTANKAFYGKLFVLTKDGVAYKVTNNGNNGVGFTFFVNNKGFLDAIGNSSYSSLNVSSSSDPSFRVHDPRSLDDLNNVTHKIFYVTPALDLPTSATQAISASENVVTWLKNTLVVPTATNITYTGVEGTPNLSGNKGAFIGFDSNLAGSYRIEITGGFPMRTLSGNCIVGTNTILWDGKDGVGNTLPANTSIGEIRVQLFGAEVHFPFIDMEINPGGIIIEQLDQNYALFSPTKDLVYWDDTIITGGNVNTLPNPILSGFLGLSSNANGHKWGRYTAASAGSGNTGDGGSSFGNEKSLDTWSFVPGEIIIKTLNIIVASADLQVVSVTPSTTTVSIGQTINYDVIVRNNGPSDVSGAGFVFNVPTGFTITGVSYVNTQGVVVVVNGVIDPVTGNYTVDLDMTNGAEIVFTFIGTVGSSLAGQPLNVEASIIRPPDVTDIDATNPGVNPPTDPHLECLNGTAVESCNNIAYNNLNVEPIPVGQVCTEDVGGAFFNLANGEDVTFNQPATNYGFQFDIYTLDNSFNLNINGTDLSLQELEFQSAGTSGINVRFVDGDQYEANTLPIWQMTGNASAPLIRIVISPTGAISMFGSKISGGPLFALQLFNGNAFNAISWNTVAPNVIIGSQTVVAVTYMTGYGSGKNITPCIPKLSLLKTGSYVDTNGDGIANVGDVITYNFAVTNTGNVTLTNVTIDDALLGLTGIVVTPSTLTEGQSGTASATYAITQADINAGQVDNLATVTGTPPTGPPVTADSEDPTPCPTCTPIDPLCITCTVVEILGTPSIAVTKDGTLDLGVDNVASAGDVITYNFAVTNTGNVTLTNVTIADALLGLTGIVVSPSTLTPGQIGAATATYTITQADIDAGQVDNLAVATGTPPSGPSVTGESEDPTPCLTCTPIDPLCTTCTVVEISGTPSIAVTKDGTLDLGADNLASVGDIITYTFAVTNTGNVTLTNVTIADALLGLTGIVVTPSTLTPGQIGAATATYTITQADIDAGQVDNLAVATGTPPSGPSVTGNSEDPTPCLTCTPIDPTCIDCTVVEVPQTPAIVVTKEGTYFDTNGDGITNIGDQINYTFTVENTGNVTLTMITVTDNNAAMSGGPLGVLAVGNTDSTTFTAVHIITQADIDAGNVYNLALATGTDPNGDPTTDESNDPTPCATCPVDPACPTCTITALMNAIDDVFNDVACDVSGITGNILANDTYSSTLVNTDPTNQVTITILTGSNPNISIDANGNINLVSGIAAGSYTFTYQICSVSTPNVCDQASVTINIIDTTAPVWTSPLPNDVTVNCDAIPVTPTLTATDTCSAVVITYTQQIIPGSCSGSYTIVNTWIASDVSNNETTYVQTITVVDTTAPVFVEALPSDLVLECTDIIPASEVLTATDTCGTAVVTFTETTVAGSCANNYTLIRVWTATDECNLTTTHTQTITVQDTTAPVFTGDLPQDGFADCDAIPEPAVLTASDNCGTVTIDFEENEVIGDCSCRSALIRTWTATDNCGNSSTYTQTIDLACQIKVWNAVSPNGDGKNDTFLLEGIDCYPKNTVQIFNRWGVKVFETNEYNNADKVFSGYSEGRSTISRNELLPTGTYFYVIKYEYSYDGMNGIKNIEKSGYLYIINK